MNIELKFPIKKGLKIQKIEYNKITTTNEPIFLKENLEDVYQNDYQIRNIVMEKETIGQVGCRFISGLRCYNYILKNRYFKNYKITPKELDEMADEGGWKKDAWADDINNPIYNVINFWELTSRVNKKLDTNIVYQIFRKPFDELTLSNLYIAINNNIPIVIKMPSLSEKYPSHFVNIDGVVKENNKYYFRIKESLKNYEGYDKFWVEGNLPGSYEIFV